MKKTIAKVVAKVAAKTAKAKTKAKSKVARKCAAASIVLAASALVIGCLNPTAPSRSQSIYMDRCDIKIYGSGATTNDLATIEIASQAMAIETSGTESQTVTPRQDNDISPDIKTTVGGATADEKTAPVEAKKTDEAVAENATTTAATP